MPLTKVWAHRGASGHAPENTLEAFARAIEMGADGIELDIQHTADGALAVIHDTAIDRTGNGHGRVVDHTLASLRAMDFCNGMEAYAGRAKLATLQEVYELLRPTSLTVNVEIKCDEVLYPGIWDHALRVEREMGMQGRVLYSSFNHYVLAALRETDPGAQIGLLYNNALFNPWVYAQYMHASAIHPHYMAALICPGLLEGCKEHGIAIHAWTANDASTVAALRDAGVDAVITNYPDMARAVIGTQSGPEAQPRASER